MAFVVAFPLLFKHTGIRTSSQRKHVIKSLLTVPEAASVTMRMRKEHSSRQAGRRSPEAAAAATESLHVTHKLEAERGGRREGKEKEKEKEGLLKPQSTFPVTHLFPQGHAA